MNKKIALALIMGSFMCAPTMATKVELHQSEVEAVDPKLEQLDTLIDEGKTEDARNLLLDILTDGKGKRDKLIISEDNEDALNKNKTFASIARNDLFKIKERLLRRQAAADEKGDTVRVNKIKDQINYIKAP